MWTWLQTGEMIGPDDVRHPGYAGKGQHKNNPKSQQFKDLGPLPCGLYDILSPIDTKTHGPYVLWLKPDPANEMFGRSAFGIHGDSVVNPGGASEGCICLPRIVREAIWKSGDHKLEVKPRPEVTPVDPGMEAE